LGGALPCRKDQVVLRYDGGNINWIVRGRFVILIYGGGEFGDENQLQSASVGRSLEVMLSFSSDCLAMRLVG
jgi:hypothetical protein